MELTEPYFALSIIVFVAVYLLILIDKFDRAVVSLSGAVLVVLLRILDQEEAFSAIDWNTITLLIGMMIIVMVMRRTGVFEYLAVKIVKVSKAEPYRLFILITLVTGLLSAILDNVTTILLMLPICLNVTRDLKLNPVPFILSAVFGSNVGGAATLIGDPPNIMIGSQAGLDFMDFIINTAVICIPMLVVTSLIFAFMFRKHLVTEDGLREKFLLLNPGDCIKDQVLLRKSLIVFGIVVIGFFLHGYLGYESSTVAIGGAVLLLFVSGQSTEEIFMELEWKTIFFFSGLFILVGSIEATGVISLLAQEVIRMTHGDLVLTTMAILWVSAIASAFIDNIPFVATMIPLILQLDQMTDMNVYPLWWALSLGACLGGNGTAIGASANVVAVGMADREGYHVSFGQYLRVAFPVMILTIVIATGYIFLVYLI